MKGNIKSFQDLLVWKKAHLFILHTYKITSTFPRTETYGLTNQIRRASVSITSNIAEGFYRRTAKDKIHFYTSALGSLAEVENQLLISKDLDYIVDIQYKNLSNTIIEIRKLLNGLINSAQTKPTKY